jgi:hypothetical protein
MKKLTLVLTLLALVSAGCGGGEKWGGYSEGQAKDVMTSDAVRNSIMDVSPVDPQGRPYTQLLPTKAKLEQTDLHKRTVEGQEAWGYEDTPNAFCLYVWKDPQSDSATTFVGCEAD